MPRTTDAREAVDRRLLLRYQEHRDVEARDRLVVRLQPFLRATVRPYLDRGQPGEDLMQVANLGLVKAIDGFHAERGGRFMSYAAPTIQGEIKRHFRDHAWALHVPRSVKEAHARTLTLADTTTYGDLLAVPRLAERAGLDREQRDNVVAADRAFRTAPIDVSMSADGGTILDTVGSDDAGYELVEQRATIERALQRGRFTPTERRILALRHHLGWRQHEIAADIGVSQMHVSRLLRALHRRLADQGDAWRDAEVVVGPAGRPRSPQATRPSIPSRSPRGRAR